MKIRGDINVCLMGGKEDDPWFFSVTFLEPVGPVDMLVSNFTEISIFFI